MKILIIEDAIDIANAVKDGLEREFFAVDIAADTAYGQGQVKVGDSIGLTLGSDGTTIATVMLGIHSEYKSGL